VASPRGFVGDITDLAPRWRLGSEPPEIPGTNVIEWDNACCRPRRSSTWKRNVRFMSTECARRVQTVLAIPQERAYCSIG